MGVRDCKRRLLVVALGCAAALIVAAPATASTLVARSAATGGAAAAQSLPPLVHNPLTDPATGKPLSCPDPSVVRTKYGPYRFVMACTSDFSAAAFGLWASRDGVHWVAKGSIFPPGHQPSWAVPAGRQHGRYWAPDLHFIDGHWVVYFAAEQKRSLAAAEQPAPQGTMAIGVATTGKLFSGRWSARLLHYSGQFNDIPANAGHREVVGGVIDPNAFRDPATGQWYLVYAKQARQIWIGTLSSDGLTLSSDVREILAPSEPWECRNPRGTCTLEGPVGYFHDGVAYVLYSASSTWSGTYTVGAAASADPFTDPFVKDPSPLLSSSRDLLGPGGTSEPVVALDGNPIIYFHTLTRPDPDHISTLRYLTVDRFRYTSQARGQLAVAGSDSTLDAPWPSISDGVPKNYTRLALGPLPALG